MLFSWGKKSRTGSIEARNHPREAPAPSAATIMSLSVSPHPRAVSGAHHERVRTLLLIATVVIVGLALAVVLLATAKTTTVLPQPSLAVGHFDLNQRFAEAAASAEPGARLDHRGENNARSTSLNPPRGPARRRASTTAQGYLQHSG